MCEIINNSKTYMKFEYFKRSKLYGAKYSEGIKKDSLYVVHTEQFSMAQKAGLISVPQMNVLISRQSSKAEKLH